LAKSAASIDGAMMVFFIGLVVCLWCKNRFFYRKVRKVFYKGAQSKMGLREGLERLSELFFVFRKCFSAAFWITKQKKRVRKARPLWSRPIAINE
jgi:hypothetical protein